MSRSIAFEFDWSVVFVNISRIILLFSLCFLSVYLHIDLIYISVMDLMYAKKKNAARKQHFALVRGDVD